jgi:hypothetical protein
VSDDPCTRIGRVGSGRPADGNPSQVAVDVPVSKQIAPSAASRAALAEPMITAMS